MQHILQRMEEQKNFYASGVTRPYAFRKKQLLLLRDTIVAHESDLHAALYADLKKSPEESWVTETGFILAEIRHTLKHLRQWMRPQKVRTNLLNFPSRSFIYQEPLGVVLIIAPWNYPFQLLFAPLVGALAAGNCVVLKPSEFAPATAAVMQTIVEKIFSPAYVQFVQGDGAIVVPALMQAFRFDHVFYTGSTEVGRKVYEMAAKNLSPVTLELGGKSPCVVEGDADIAVAAKRIALTKFSNAGQMCVAPDYLLVHSSVRDALVEALKKYILEFFSHEAHNSYSYGKIINEKQFNRLLRYLKEGTLLHGGSFDAARLYIEPTLLGNLPPDAVVMGDEVFGPVLPILSFTSFEEARDIIQKHPDPLAFYLFTQSREKEKQWLDQISFGGGCVNNASWHLTNYHLPFGGRGNSGTGAYHGQYSFRTFSHSKAVMKTPTWFDPKIKYPPFKGKLNLFKKIIR